MTITTKMGDKGKSRWLGKEVAKDDILLETIGEIDELMAVLGVIKLKVHKVYKVKIEKIIQDLYLIMGLLSGYEGKKINLEERIMNLEKEIEKLEKELKPINEFIVFRKKEAVYLNWARTVVRRVERRVVSLSKKQKIDGSILIFFNRLSDYLFILSRKFIKL